MLRNMEQYFGTYHRFNTTTKNEGALLLGADNLVGDIFEVEFSIEDGKNRAWMKNKFDKKVAFFEGDFSRKLSIFKARGWTVKTLLSFVAYSDTPEPGVYWGEAAVICFDPSLADTLAPFIENLAQHMARGVRPNIDLSEQTVANLVSSKGSWFPSKRVPLPNKKKGSAIVKSQRSATENLIEQGRKGNKGCYALTIVFFALLAAAIVLGLKACGGI